jgi:hypothetical protein
MVGSFQCPQCGMGRDKTPGDDCAAIIAIPAGSQALFLAVLSSGGVGS